MQNNNPFNGGGDAFRGLAVDPADEALRGQAVDHNDFRRLKREQLAKTMYMWANTPSPSPEPEKAPPPPAAEKDDEDAKGGGDAR